MYHNTLHSRSLTSSLPGCHFDLKTTNKRVKFETFKLLHFLFHKEKKMYFPQNTALKVNALQDQKI